MFRIVGSIPAVNFIKLPKHKPLGLGGRFLYLQVKCLFMCRVALVRAHACVLVLQVFQTLR